MREKECCGSCDFSEREGSGEFVCCNPDSEFFTDYVESVHVCGDYAAVILDGSEKE